jgi:hypothetical protein
MNTKEKLVIVLKIIEATKGIIEVADSYSEGALKKIIERAAEETSKKAGKVVGVYRKRIRTDPTSFALRVIESSLGGWAAR